ncbi:hypothetical protein TNIN_219881 [Trichonephila inaurata madagascariensis]|uniref:DUF4817 domain-containing protein n=1 Tax=Trichonephila inaurata madagascariensis TaxID=2747483 RepID=A0A8X6WXT0_9ARAC|nr:hypothetical protein TNIN_219881 [Trichonephila inaurata madagascariensis]
MSIVEKTLLVKLYYRNLESAIATLRAYRYMKGMRDSKGSVTSSALNKMMKKFEATCLSRHVKEVDVAQQPQLFPRHWSRRCNPCRWLLRMGSALLEKFRDKQECRMEVSGKHCE